MTDTNHKSQNNVFCKYKDILGKPNEGVHKYRFFGFAIVDVLLVFPFVYIFTYYTNYSFWKTLVVTFLIGIFLHRLFCVRTRIDKILFPYDA
jgi:hypothetical protein